MKGTIKSVLSLAMAFIATVTLSASNRFISFTPSEGSTCIAFAGSVYGIVVDSSGEWEGVLMAAENLALDFERVTGVKPTVGKEGNIIIGTLGKSAAIENLLSADEKAQLHGKREKYLIKATEGQVVIAGSDKRGTTYGIYTLSKEIGVSPWYWWADVPAEKHNEIYIRHGLYTEGEPGVFYRGIFLNDEAPALTGWVNENTNGYTHEFYVHVFELLLRLKANFLWPAMWDAAFYDDDAENMKYADTMGIIMSTSHHEPCARAQKEWHRYGSGAWDYTQNADVLMSFWKEGIERMKDTEDVVTIGMRGDGDMAMSQGTNIALLERIIKDQRKMISKVTGKPASETPQVWALYKEVQDYYDEGMRVPDDVTLLLCDDNWGNVRKLPAIDAKPRSGGYGMYYHFDYVGAPRNYKWINTNQIQRIWEQMNLCWEYGVRKLWVVNVGDLKPVEYPIQFFMDMAWNPEAYNPDNLFQHTVDFAGDTFGEKYAQEIGKIINLYSKYSRRVTPELLTADTYSFTDGEWPRVMNEWRELELRALRVYRELDPSYSDAYEELVLFPIQAFGNVYELYYAVAMNKNSSDIDEINHWADVAEAAYRRDAELCWHYNHEIAGGKWNHMMDQNHIGYTNWQEPRVQSMPAVKRINGSSPLCHLESDKRISIEAMNFRSTHTATDDIRIAPIKDLGRTDGAVTTLPAAVDPKDRSVYVEYLVETESEGNASMTVYLAPTLNWNQNVGLTYAVSVDGGEEMEVNFNGHYKGELGQWQGNSIIESRARLNFGAPGRHTVRFRFLSPGIVLEKMVINFGGLGFGAFGGPGAGGASNTRTYLGAPSSKLVN